MERGVRGPVHLALVATSQCSRVLFTSPASTRTVQRFTVTGHLHRSRAHGRRCLGYVRVQLSHRYRSDLAEDLPYDLCFPWPDLGRSRGGDCDRQVRSGMSERTANVLRRPSAWTIGLSHPEVINEHLGRVTVRYGRRKTSSSPPTRALPVPFKTGGSLSLSSSGDIPVSERPCIRPANSGRANSCRSMRG